MTFLVCGVCGARFADEALIRAHTAEARHDGEPWGTCTDILALVGRTSEDDPWRLAGSWSFIDDPDRYVDESLGWTIRQMFRDGCVEVRVLHRNEAERLYASSEQLDSSTTLPEYKRLLRDLSEYERLLRDLVRKGDVGRLHEIAAREGWLRAEAWQTLQRHGFRRVGGKWARPGLEQSGEGDAAEQPDPEEPGAE